MVFLYSFSLILIYYCIEKKFLENPSKGHQTAKFITSAVTYQIVIFTYSVALGSNDLKLQFVTLGSKVSEIFNFDATFSFLSNSTCLFVTASWNKEWGNIIV